MMIPIEILVAAIVLVLAILTGSFVLAGLAVGIAVIPTAVSVLWFGYQTVCIAYWLARIPGRVIRRLTAVDQVQ